MFDDIYTVVLINAQKQILMKLYYSDLAQAEKVQKNCQEGIKNNKYDIVLSDDSEESTLVNLSHIFSVKIESKKGVVIS